MQIGGLSWVPWAVTVMVVAIIALRSESRAARADAMIQRALEELTQSKRDQATELQLRRYNLDWFRAHEFAELEVKAGILESRLNDCRRN